MNRLTAIVLIAFLLIPAAASAQQKEKPPEGGKPKNFSLPPRKSFTLPSGLEATLVQYGTVPKAAIEVIVRFGMANEGPGQTWLSDITGELLKEGTVTRAGDVISREAAGMGGSVSVSVGADETLITSDVLSESAPAMVALLADVTRNPRFDGDDFTRIRKDKLRELNVAKANPQNMTNTLFRKLMFPDHPYGRMMPTEEMLNGFTPAMVRAFYDSSFCAARTHVYVVGRFDEREVEEAIREGFAGWTKGTPVPINIPKPVSERDIHIIDRPGAAQSTVYIGLPVVDPSSKDYMALRVTDALLGGSFGSRITANIRERHGYTYSPRSVISSRYRNAYWVEQADVTTDVTGPSIKEIFYEIDSLRRVAPSAEELKGIQNYLAGFFVLQNSSRGGIIGQLDYMNLHGLPPSYLTKYVGNIFGVKPADVRRVAREVLRPDAMRIVIAGDKAKIESQVAGFGKVVE